MRLGIEVEYWIIDRDGRLVSPDRLEDDLERLREGGPDAIREPPAEIHLIRTCVRTR